MIQKKKDFHIFNFLGVLTLVHAKNILKSWVKNVRPSVRILTLDFSRRLIDLGHSDLV
jgi:hypothetical protein